MTEAPVADTWQARRAKLEAVWAEQHGKVAPYLYRLVHHWNRRPRKTWNDEWGDGTVVIRIEGNLWQVKGDVADMILAAAKMVPPENEYEKTGRVRRDGE